MRARLDDSEPLPKCDIKPLEERIAEARSLELSKPAIRCIEDKIRRSEKDNESNLELSHPRIPKIADIQAVVAKYFDISVLDIIAHRRTANVMRPRMIAMYLSKTLTPRSLPEIGRFFGNRDHTTIMHAVRTIESIIAGTYTFNKNYSRLNASNATLEKDIGMLKRKLLDLP